jgi:predicted dehydrogenase
MDVTVREAVDADWVEAGPHDVVAGSPSPGRRYASFADGHEEMLLGDAVLESSRTGRWVEVARQA